MRALPPAATPPASALPQPAGLALSSSPVQVGPPRLSVVIVNYRQWDKTSELVRQLLASACVRHGHRGLLPFLATGSRAVDTGPSIDRRRPARQCRLRGDQDTDKPITWKNMKNW